MLDSDVDRIRSDRLRSFLEERKQDAEAERVDAIADDRLDAATERTAEIEAYEAVLDYLDAHFEEGDSRGLSEIRE
ncbi:hypothetical protein [Natronomonas gomsonensis]|uniref:hypothetical protein n=1 Tax=Natronomonas gomsonensis TaxID=1046043 RepID=UPI0015B86F92|nr:hypothetical protein [Natronomonas gomsonensis]